MDGWISQELLPPTPTPKFYTCLQWVMMMIHQLLGLSACKGGTPTKDSWKKSFINN